MKIAISVLTFCLSFFIEKYKVALRWISGAFAGWHIFTEYIKPMLGKVKNTMDSFEIGQAPAGYSLAQAQADHDQIVEALALNAFTTWDTYTPGHAIDALMNDDEATVIEIFERNTGAQNRFLERAWNVKRGKNMRSEILPQLDQEEQETVISNLNKNP